jgi:hypothetical protein
VIDCVVVDESRDMDELDDSCSGRGAIRLPISFQLAGKKYERWPEQLSLHSHEVRARLPDKRILDHQHSPYRLSYAIKAIADGGLHCRERRNFRPLQGRAHPAL